jgi:hypothetical protein
VVETVETEKVVEEPAAPDTFYLSDDLFLIDEVNQESKEMVILERVGRVLAENMKARLVINPLVEAAGAFEINSSIADDQAFSVKEYFTSSFRIKSSRVVIAPVSAGSAAAVSGTGERSRPYKSRLQIILLHRPE